MSIDVGVLKNHNTMLSLRSIQEGLLQTPRLVVNLEHREVVVFFQLGVFNRHQKATRAQDTFQDYRLKLSFGQLKRILQTRPNELGSSISHIISIDTPPVYHRRLKDINSTFSVNSWRDADTWFRQTDIVHIPENLARLPISLRKHASIINIGKRDLE
jgi:RNA-dependent RNA polymerase